MVYIILAIIAILVLMTLIIYFILKKTIDVVNAKGKMYFTLKLQDYENKKEENRLEENNKVADKKKNIIDNDINSEKNIV